MLNIVPRKSFFALFAIIAMVAIPLLLFGISSFSWAATPSEKEITPLIKTAWINDPPLYEAGNRGDLGEAKGTVTAVNIKNLEIRKSRYGRFKQSIDVVDTYGPKITSWPTSSNMKYGPKITYWPVTVRIETTYRLSRLSLRNIEGREKELIQEVEHTCYLFQDKDGSWKVTFEDPKDETPFYKF